MYQSRTIAYCSQFFFFHELHSTYNKIRRCTHILSMPRQGFKNVLFKVPQPHNPLQCLHFGPTTLKNKISLLISRKKCTLIIWLSFHENFFERSKVKGQNITLLNTHERTPVEYSLTVCYEKFRTNKVLFLLTSNRWSMVWFDPMDLSSFFYT